ncbi:MAG: response regulator, partial [Bdellovibrionota bacterium]
MHNILLVEDSLEFQHIISQTLSEQYNMLLSSNLKDARVIVEQNDIHLILLDINLPDQDGYIFLQQLKSHNLTQKIPVI